MRTVETSFNADDKVIEAILESVIGQLSDGIWENSPAMNKYWVGMSIQDNDILVSDNFTVSYCKTRYNNPFFNMPDEKVKSWFADKLKAIVKHEEKDSGGKNWWKRDNMQELDYLSRMYKDEEGVIKTRTVTVADAYKVYDRLKGRKAK